MTTRQRSGRHFLQIPGPTNVPYRILRAMDRPEEALALAEAAWAEARALSPPSPEAVAHAGRVLATCLLDLIRPQDLGEILPALADA